MVARWAHNPKAEGSNPSPATTKNPLPRSSRGFLFSDRSPLAGLREEKQSESKGERKKAKGESRKDTLKLNNEKSNITATPDGGGVILFSDRYPLAGLREEKQSESKGERKKAKGERRK